MGKLLGGFIFFFSIFLFADNLLPDFGFVSNPGLACVGFLGLFVGLILMVVGK
jgi:hypothetical protein